MRTLYHKSYFYGNIKIDMKSSENESPQIPIFVISLPKSLKRRESMEKQFSDLGLNFEYSKITEIKDLEHLGADIWSTKLEEKFNNGEYQKGEIACASSHRNVYQKMVEENIGKALICEDDIIIYKDFKNILENLSKINDVDWLQIDYPKSGFGFFVNWLKANQVRIKNNLFYSFIFLLKLFPMILLCTYEFLLEKIIVNFTKNKYKEVYFFRKLFFASCYIVTLDAARKLLKAQTPLMYTADRLPNILRNKNFKIKGVMPRLVYQDNDQFTSDLLVKIK